MLTCNAITNEIFRFIENYSWRPIYISNFIRDQIIYMCVTHVCMYMCVLFAVKQFKLHIQLSTWKHTVAEKLCLELLFLVVNIVKLTKF